MFINMDSNSRYWVEMGVEGQIGKVTIVIGR